MSQKEIRQLKQEAKKNNLPYDLVKRAYRHLNTIQRRNLLDNSFVRF